MEETADEKSKSQSEIDKYLDKFLAALPVDPTTRTSVDQTLRNLYDVAQKVPPALSAAFKTMVEFVQQLTNIKGVNIQLKSFKALDVQLHTLHDAEVPINHDLGAMGKIESLHIGRKLHMAAEIGEFNKDYLRLHVHEGMKLAVVVPLLGRQLVELKGSTKLAHDEKKQLVIICTAFLPGTDVPVTVTVPFNAVLDQLKKATVK